MWTVVLTDIAQLYVQECCPVFRHARILQDLAEPALQSQYTAPRLNYSPLLRWKLQQAHSISAPPEQ